MLARLHSSMEKRDEGFTLIELLVVMIIIGILAAIAIPVFLNQRKKAVDTAGKSDVSVLGKEVATFLVDGTALPVIATAGNPLRYTVDTTDAGRVSNGVTLPIFGPVSTVASSTSAWCVQVTVTGGTVGFQHYSSTGGLGVGACV